MTPAISTVAVALVAALHILISAIEMLFWNKPRVHQRLGFNAVEAMKVAPIVANAGLYNGFLAAGLIWALMMSGDSTAVKSFFLICVIIAGVFGAITLKWTTLVMQTVPAAIALAFVSGASYI